MPVRHSLAVDLRRLECFLAVVDCGTVTAAAQQIRLAQPALSRQLAAFEKEMGVALFYRARGRLHLTPAGRAFAPIARELMAGVTRTEAAARSFADGAVPRLVLAAPTATVTELVAPFLARLRPDDPLVAVREASPTGAYRALGTDADFAISPAPPIGSLAHLRLGAVPLQASVAREHPWARAGRERVSLPELLEHRLFLLSEENTSRVVLDLAVGQAGLRYVEVEECAVARIAQAHAVAGHGVCVVTDYPRFGAHVVTIDDPRAPETPLHLSLSAAWDRGHFAAATIEALAARIKLFLAESPAALRGTGAST
jgi:DNA-binding transcriptional LysR family regulator